MSVESSGPERIPTRVEGMPPEVSRRLKSQTQTVYNVRQTIIVISRDRLVNVLTRNRPKLIRVELVLTLFGLFSALLLALLTSDFEKMWGITPAQWSAGFFIATCASAVWFVVELLRLLLSRLTIDGLVDLIEEESDRPLG